MDCMFHLGQGKVMPVFLSHFVLQDSENKREGVQMTFV